ncbi:Ser/Thr protein kinase [Mucor ambiguus]|uniref:non-specific serine/threonine protein kinase n=1 Tax=Mucor ambiguus TaxID=91626 RepID=A0A0C9MQK6_9FUNG|nr:Ser/Thr protein kinase [Mucor ambiguus]
MTSPPCSVHSTDGKPADNINERPASFIGDWTTATVDTHRERLVEGPDGNKILCDSPISSEPPAYAGPDGSSSISPHTLTPQTSREADKRPAILPVTSTTHTSRRSMSSERAKPRRIIGNYTLVNTLGSGSMGKVRLAVHNITGDKLAVKIVPRRIHSKDKHQQQRSAKKDKDEHREIRTIREASIMLLLHHPFIASLKEMVILDPYYYLFMEYVNGGQLLDYIISHGKLKEKQARQFGRQILSALDYCHRNSIVHRDLKIENILISQAGNIKIIDFGLSNLFSPRSSLSTFCGSLYFAAPELLNAKAYTGPEVDVWSFGVVLYVLVCGKVPFDDQNMPALHEKIKRGVVDYPSHLSTDCKSVLSRMLVTNPAHRATVSEIMVHSWMNKGYDGPIDNYLPDRIPLSLPIDMEVVRGMTGFEFGTEIDIRDKLQDIITSEEYQKAAKTLMERTAEAHRNQRQGHLTSRFSPHLGKKAFTLPNDDPQSIPAAYHPLISIYYLVKERMEREKRIAANAAAAASTADTANVYPLHTSPKSSSTTTSKASLRIPDISLPETVHPIASVPFEQSLFGDPDMFSPTAVSTGVAYGKKGKTQIRVDDQGHLIDNDKLHLIENGLSRLFSRSSSNGHPRHHRHSIQSDSADEEIYDLNRTASHESSSSHNVLRRLSHALSRRASTDKNGETSAARRARKLSVHGGHPVIVSSTSTPIQIPSRESNGGHLSKSYAAAPTLKFPDSRFTPPKQQRHTAGGGIDQSDLDVATAAAAAASVSNNGVSHNTFSSKISKIMPRRMTLGQNAMNAENHTNFLNMVGNHQPFTASSTNNKRQSISSQQNPLNEGRLASAKGPVSALPSHVTATVSENSDLGLARHAHDPLYSENVNSPHQQQQQQHDHEQAFPTSAHNSNSSSKATQKGTADENIKPVFLKGLFSVTTTSTKHPSVIRADLIRVLERIGVKWRESKGRFECVHMPSIDLNRVVDSNNNSSSLEDQAMQQIQGRQSFSSEDHTTATPSNATATVTATTPVVPLPDLVVRFEIYIVKVPWLLGMHGLQFRRVGGDPWQYKNMCSKILAELKL